MKHQTDLKYTPPFAVLLPLMYIIVFFYHNPIIAQASNTEKTLMAVFAHPDDEITAGAILNKYAEEGVKVYLVVATDGRFGTNDRTAHVAGDGLAALRREEMQCSADKLGVELIHLEYEDQLRSAGGFDGHIPHIRSLMKDIYDIIERTQPDAIITFGPDGWSNHMDHRLVGAQCHPGIFKQKMGETHKPFLCRQALKWYGRSGAKNSRRTGHQLSDHQSLLFRKKQGYLYPCAGLPQKPIRGGCLGKNDGKKKQG